MKVGIITLFPDAISSIKSQKAFGLVGKTFEQKKIKLIIEDLREHGLGKHKVVDDTPYGGGDGMVLKPEPVASAVESLLAKMDSSRENTKIIFFCPSGNLWTQVKAESWSCELKGKALILICGRYAGIDQRAVEALVDEKISMGPYILNGGELPALCVLETLARLIPGVLGNPESVLQDSFSKGISAIESNSYTKPQVWNGRAVPEVLVSGDHKKIEAFRREESSRKTKDWLTKAKVSLEEACRGESG